MFKLLLGIFLISNLALAQESDTVLKAEEVPIHSILSEAQILTLHEDFTYSHHVDRKIVVVSPEGLDHAFTRLFYDKLNSVEEFELEVRDLTSGKTIKKARLKDMGDAAYYSTSTIFDDNRYKYFEVAAAKFPIEVSIKSQVSSKSNFFLPRWTPVPNFNQKVTEASLTVKYPTRLGLKYKELNLKGNKKEEELAGVTSITWSERDLAAQPRDFDSDEDPRLLLAPVKFALDQYSGEMGSWSGLAAWQFELNQGRDVLPEDFKEKVLQLVVGVDDPYEKVKILYEYLQKNFRYVSIQLGIGGWQTMTAADVVKYSYGDCKGLTNLMKAMLDAADIPSNYTLVFAGSDAEDIEVDLPSNQFNHVILQVPTSSHPIWLECTSNLLPAGYLGDFTKNRHVLVTSKGGGNLTKTPSYDTEEWNEIRSQSKVILDDRGNAKINTEQQFFGNFAAYILYVKGNLDERQQRDFLNRNSSVSGLIVQDYRIEVANQDSLPVTELAFDGLLQKFSQMTAKRAILRPFLGKLGPSHLTNKSLKKVDEYEIELPAAWKVDGDLPRVSLEEENLKGLLEMAIEGKTLRVRRELSLKIPTELDKEEEAELLRKINTAFDRTVFFVNTTTTQSTSPANE
ncbi:DUF3857 domain-containing protein [Algoriphagus aestuariicola]|uniref:DUF3857 domain-containing protein n=1 Tax=Algoriphagus aestuariicola TaxID=1852016 RepID=A0ABS3BTD8_9BACT|nr:DUF3857 domain-containing protein [Algoriphagus aestuariicola]MBN7802554.1 DUF3857 domain-containing protein [Algoriphagus aestuariicola]